eukprot:4429797-Amphidinium_carterae.1
MQPKPHPCSNLRAKRRKEDILLKKITFFRRTYAFNLFGCENSRLAPPTPQMGVFATKFVGGSSTFGSACTIPQRSMQWSKQIRIPAKTTVEQGTIPLTMPSMLRSFNTNSEHYRLLVGSGAKCRPHGAVSADS